MLHAKHPINGTRKILISTFSEDAHGTEEGKEEDGLHVSTVLYGIKGKYIIWI